MFELLIPIRPVSAQAKDREHLKAWKNTVYGRARDAWKGPPYTGSEVRFTLVYLRDDDAADTDNIIKPIQDGLIGVVIPDDSLVSDVDSHRRFISDGIDITRLPSLLIEGVASGVECVYVRITAAGSLDTYL